MPYVKLSLINPQNFRNLTTFFGVKQLKVMGVRVKTVPTVLWVALFKDGFKI